MNILSCCHSEVISMRLSCICGRLNNVVTSIFNTSKLFSNFLRPKYVELLTLVYSTVCLICCYIKINSPKIFYVDKDTSIKILYFPLSSKFTVVVEFNSVLFERRNKKFFLHEMESNLQQLYTYTLCRFTMTYSIKIKVYLYFQNN